MQKQEQQFGIAIVNIHNGESSFFQGADGVALEMSRQEAEDELAIQQDMFKRIEAKHTRVEMRELH
jgi:hypothetical protein